MIVCYFYYRFLTLVEPYATFVYWRVARVFFRKEVSMFYRHERDFPLKRRRSSLLELPVTQQERNGVTLRESSDGAVASLPLSYTVDLPTELLDAGVEVELLIGWELIIRIYVRKTGRKRESSFDEVCNQSNSVVAKIWELVGHMLHRLLRIAFHWERVVEYKPSITSAYEQLYVRLRD